MAAAWLKFSGVVVFFGTCAGRRSNLLSSSSACRCALSAFVRYRAARAKGITPTTIDTVIAAIALQHNASVFTLDQDFYRIARITRLALYSF